MAPIYDQLMQPRLTLGIPATNYSSRCSSQDIFDFYLPICRRGFFLKDSFFEYAHAVFDDAVRKILERWGETDFIVDKWDDMNIRLTNNLTRYRQLRARHRRESNQAVTVTTDNTSHKIVMDVQDFLDGEVKVKVVGERDVLVEGCTKTRDGDLGYYVSCQSFRRRFSLPHLTDTEAITSALSSDGILTITAPKIVSHTKEEGSIIPLTVEGIWTTNVAHSSPSTTQAAPSTTQAAPLITQAAPSITQAAPLTTLAAPLTTQAAPSTTLAAPSTTQVAPDTNTNTNTNWKVQEEKECDLEVCQRKKAQPSALKSKFYDEGDKDLTQVDTTLDKCSFLTIPRRGLFFTDPFFKESWQDFRDAVRSVLSRWEVPSSSTDDLACYRSLRSSDTSEETQAMKSSEDDYSHKFVMDVHDFIIGGEITVKVTEERELVVEGHMGEEEEGDSISPTKQFLRRFLLPLDVRTASLAAVMSTDGVLTITAPKESPELRLKEAAVSVDHEKEQKVEGFGRSPEPNLWLGRETPTREPSPAPCSIRTDDSCDSLAGTLWTFLAGDESPVCQEFSSGHSSPLVLCDD